MGKVFLKTNIYIPQEQSQESPSRQVLYILSNYSQFFATAPVTGIKILLQVDFNLSKTLKGNFNLTIFLDLPVVISLTGVQALHNESCNGERGDIFDLYLRERAESSGEIKITIKNAVYQGVIVALSQQSTLDFPGVSIYNLTLFGVRIQ